MDDFYQSFRGSVGKGNLAQYMTNKGYTQSFRESEDLMRPFKAGSYGVDVKKAINAIHNAGGKAFLAHPNNLKKDDDTLLAKIKEFMSLGLDGIECFHSNHSEEQTNLYLK
jgi:predicted metal-dependent phosphoesterase TrpH